MDKWNAVKAEALEEEEMLAEEVRPRSVEEIGHAKKQRIAEMKVRERGSASCLSGSA